MSTGSKALDRPIHQWLSEIDSGRLVLPSFQRAEAWDRKRIESMLKTIVRDLPLGITLVLEVGDEEKFHSRPLATAPSRAVKASEHLLDGQQRLTALWRALKDNYEDWTFFVHVPTIDDDPTNDDHEVGVWSYKTWQNSTGNRMPRWADDATQTARRGLIPLRLLDPQDETGADQWIDEATASLRPSALATDVQQVLAAMEAYEARRKLLKDVVAPLREIIRHYRLPYLSLPATTPKEVALDVFVNMNTNSKPLKPYDIVVAEVENRTGERLHERVADLRSRHPEVARFGGTEELALQTAALLQDKAPNRGGFYSLDSEQLIADWSAIGLGLAATADLLSRMNIWDSERLPTAIPFPVVAAILARAPIHGDARGSIEHLCRSYLWRSFFTSRYDGAAATRAYADYRPLASAASATGSNNSGGAKAPVFDPVQYPLPTPQQLIAARWPKGRSSLSRAVLAAANSFGARDFADDSILTARNVGTREYHHLFPDKLLQDAGIDSYLALNCALITWKTNRTIGRMDPVAYLEARSAAAPAPQAIAERLTSHLVPADELYEAGPYSPTDDAAALAESVKPDFDAFLHRRAALIGAAMELLCVGAQPQLSDVLSRSRAVTS